jgi:hypothetical protein
VVQNAAGPDNLEEMQRLIDLYSDGRETLANRDLEIQQLRAQLEDVQTQLGRMTLPESLADEIKLQHPGIAQAGVGMFRTSGGDRWAPRVEVLWQDSLMQPWTTTDQHRVSEWLRLRMQLPELKIVHNDLQLNNLE